MGRVRRPSGMRGHLDGSCPASASLRAASIVDSILARPRRHSHSRNLVALARDLPHPSADAGERCPWHSFLVRRIRGSNRKLQLHCLRDHKACTADIIHRDTACRRASRHSGSSHIEFSARATRVAHVRRGRLTMVAVDSRAKEAVAGHRFVCAEGARWPATAFYGIGCNRTRR